MGNTNTHFIHSHKLDAAGGGGQLDLDLLWGAAGAVAAGDAWASWVAIAGGCNISPNDACGRRGLYSVHAQLQRWLVCACGEGN